MDEYKTIRIKCFDEDINNVRRSRRFIFSLSQLLNSILNGSHNLTIAEENTASGYADVSSSCRLIKCNYLLRDDRRPKYPWRLLLGIDQVLNVLIFNGSHKETISSSISRKIDSGKATKTEIMICKVLRKLEAKHCKKSLGE